MENELQNRPENLLAGLRSWNRQEQQFKELFSADALKDREFLKMKLGVYAGLFHQYEGRVSTTDEKAMLLMLRFQKRKLERQLYPGLLKRLVNRAVNRIRAWLQPKPANPVSPEPTPHYVYSSIPVKPPEENRDKRQETQRRTYGQDLGRRQQNHNHKQKTQGL